MPVILPRLKSDIVEVFKKTVSNQIEKLKLKWKTKSMTIVFDKRLPRSV